MNIQLLSDLHLEAHPHFVPEPAHGADVLVLAGDVGSYQQGSQLDDDDFGLARFSPLSQYAGWPTPVLFVPGNHEYDAQDFDAAHLRLRRTCHAYGEPVQKRTESSQSRPRLLRHSLIAMRSSPLLPWPQAQPIAPLLALAMLTQVFWKVPLTLHSLECFWHSLSARSWALSSSSKL